MIVNMLKTAVICRKADRTSCLERLGQLGVLHVEQSRRPESDEQSSLVQELASFDRVLSALAERSAVKDAALDLTPEEAMKRTIAALNAIADTEKRLEALRRDEEKLRPWGDFSFEDVDALKASGLSVSLCVAAPEDLVPLAERGVVHEVSRDKRKVYFAFVSQSPTPPPGLPLAPLPTERKRLKDIEADIARLTKGAAQLEHVLDTLAAERPLVKSWHEECRAKLEFVVNANGMGEDKELCYIKGFIPADQEAALKQAALQDGWAVLATTPEPDDNVPTYIRTPKIFAMSKAIFDFIGISPGYREWDISVCFLVFFTIYFGMIVGDGGYALLFLAACGVAKFALRHSGKPQPALNLFILLSCSTLIWGVLNGNYFGITQNKIPGLDFFTCEAKDSNIQFICFLLAAIHLSFARVWKAIIYINRPMKALGQLGWALILWGNFFVAVKLIVYSQSPLPGVVPWLYLAGVGLVFACYVEWTNVGSVFNLPFGFIGSFVDMLSFIRLFAVGLAGFYVANSFNMMAGMLWHSSNSWMMFPVLLLSTVILLLFGHLLNIALGLMGVLVHGIRLNTLEFSNHMELEWAGHEYKPFKRGEGKAG